MLSKPDWCPPDIWSTSVNAAGGEEFAYQAVAEGAARLVCNERARIVMVLDGERVLPLYRDEMDATEADIAYDMAIDHCIEAIHRVC